MSPPPTRSSTPLGLGAAVLSATLLAIATIFSAQAYGQGCNPATLIWLRFAIAGLGMTLTALWLRRPLRIARDDWRYLAGIACGVFGMTNGYMTSVAFIPVSLAVLIFYTYPLLVGTAEALTERRPLGATMAFCYLLALAGLALALGPSFEELDWRGLALAALAAVCGPLAFLSARRLGSRADPLATGALSLAGCLVAMSLLLPLSSTVALPSTGAGWLALLLAVLLFMFGYLLQLLSLRLAPAGPVALVFNFEPAVTVVAAWPLLGITLSPGQSLGVALVLLALLIGTLRRIRAPRRIKSEQ